MKRWPAISLLALAFSLSSCSTLRHCWARCVGSIPSTGGKELHIEPSAGEKTLLQKDKRWADVPLGPTKLTLGTHGCLVTCAAMGCCQLGVQLTPKELNERLNRSDGFFPNGWLVWNAIPAVTDGKLDADYHDTPGHEPIDEALEQHTCPVVKFFLPGGTPHWCLVVGKVGADYLVRDPLRDEAEPLRLSALTNRIHAVRVIRKNVMREE